LKISTKSKLKLSKTCLLLKNDIGCKIRVNIEIKMRTWVIPASKGIILNITPIKNVIKILTIKLKTKRFLILKSFFLGNKTVKRE
jgi:hypothetical protein